MVIFDSFLYVYQRVLGYWILAHPPHPLFVRTWAALVAFHLVGVDPHGVRTSVQQGLQGVVVCIPWRHRRIHFQLENDENMGKYGKMMKNDHFQLDYFQWENMGNIWENDDHPMNLGMSSIGWSSSCGWMIIQMDRIGYTTWFHWTVGCCNWQMFSEVDIKPTWHVV